MKKIAALLLLLVVAGVLWMPSAYRSLQDRHSEHVSDSLGQYSPADSAAEPPDPPDAPQRAPRAVDLPGEDHSSEVDSEAAALESIIRAMADATRAIDFAERLTELAELEPGLANWRLANLRVLCLPTRSERNRDTREVEQDLARFCEGFDHDDWPLNPDGDVGFNSLASLMIDRMVIQESMQRAPQNQHSDLFTQLLRSARTPEEVLSLLEYLHGSADAFGQSSVWRLGADLREQFYPEANLPEAQRAAIILFKCRRFGGCGPQHQFRIVYCQSFLQGNCRTGSTVEDMVFLTTASVTHALALEILDRI